MNTYFRITAYNPTLDISYIIDSVDKHENIGQFCVAKKRTYIWNRIAIFSIKKMWKTTCFLHLPFSLFTAYQILRSERKNRSYFLSAILKCRIEKQNCTLRGLRKENRQSI